MGRIYKANKYTVSKRLVYILAMALISLSIACDKNEECGGTQTITYQVGTDVSQDFTASAVTFSGQILESTCDQLPAGTTADGDVDTLVRSGTSIVFTDGDKVQEAAISGTDILEHARTEEVFSGCALTVTTTGVVQTSDNTLVTSGVFVARGLACNL